MVNKDKIMIILTNNTSSYNDSPLTTNNKAMTTTIKQRQLNI